MFGLYRSIKMDHALQQWKEKPPSPSTHRGTLREFICSHHLHIQVLALRLPPGFDQPLEHLRERQREYYRSRKVMFPESDAFEWANLLYLGWGHFNVDDDGCEGGFGELCRMVDGVCVQNHQLQGFGELKYPLNLTLNLRCRETSHFVCSKSSVLKSKDLWSFHVDIWPWALSRY